MTLVQTMTTGGRSQGRLPRAMLLMLLLLLLQITVAGSLSLGQLSPSARDGGMGELEGAGGLVGVGEVAAAAAAKRDGRRITRGRYRMGYMFGKRSGAEGTSASLLIKSLIGKAMSVEDLTRGLQSDPGLAERVARHMDRNGETTPDTFSDKIAIGPRGDLPKSNSNGEKPVDELGNLQYANNKAGDGYVAVSELL